VGFCFSKYILLLAEQLEATENLLSTPFGSSMFVEKRKEENKSTPSGVLCFLIYKT